MAACTPLSGAVLRAGPLKVTYLFETDNDYFVVCRYRQLSLRSPAMQASVGLEFAYRVDLGPVPCFGSDGRLIHAFSGSQWVMYSFLHGPVLASLPQLIDVYEALGGIAAAWHSSSCKCEAVGWSLLDSLDLPFVPEAVKSKAKQVLADCSSPVLLHGDLNATNIVLTPKLKAIDFDEAGMGPPELDLAIALGYINTCEEDVSACFEAILRGYGHSASDAFAEAVANLTTLIPWYFMASMVRSFGPSVVTPSTVSTVLSQYSFLCRSLSSRTE